MFLLTVKMVHCMPFICLPLFLTSPNVYVEQASRHHTASRVFTCKPLWLLFPTLHVKLLKKLLMRRAISCGIKYALSMPKVRLEVHKVAAQFSLPFQALLDDVCNVKIWSI